MAKPSPGWAAPTVSLGRGTLKGTEHGEVAEKAEEHQNPTGSWGGHPADEEPKLHTHTHISNAPAQEKCLPLQSSVPRIELDLRPRGSKQFGLKNLFSKASWLKVWTVAQQHRHQPDACSTCRIAAPPESAKPHVYFTRPTGDTQVLRIPRCSALRRPGSLE